MEQLKQCDRLELRGLMAIPPFFENPEESRPFFAGCERSANSTA